MTRRRERNADESRLSRRDLVRVASLGLRSRRVRALLSALGISIGIAAIVGVLGISQSSKSGLLGMTRALALELAPEGITANGISPGPFATELTRPVMDNPQLNAQFMANVPLGRWGKPEEIGHLAVYLCSEEAGFITGTDILIDGGWTAR